MTNLKLTNSGLYWLKIDIANCYGLDKELFEDRISWVDRNLLTLETLIDTADSKLEYIKAITALRSHELGQDVHHYMYLDCSNQALQLYAVLTSCLDTAKVCNLGGFNGLMTDAYTMISVSLNNKFRTDIFTRKNCKRSLMTTLYGKQNGGDTILEDMLDEELTKLYNLGIDSDTLNLAFKESMYDIAPNAMKAMKLIQALNNEHIGTYNWVMPDGFRVKYDVRSNQEFEGKRVSAKGIEFSFHTTNKVYKPSRFNAGMAPNVIHSIDGYIVRELVRRMEDKFITPIHDAYAVHPNDIDFMINNYKDIMIELLNSEILDNIMSQIADGRVYAKIQKANTLKEEHIRNSLYDIA